MNWSKVYNSCAAYLLLKLAEREGKVISVQRLNQAVRTKVGVRGKTQAREVLKVTRQHKRLSGTS